MKITISNKVYVEGDIDLIESLKEEFIWENPGYKQWLRMIQTHPYMKKTRPAPPKYVSLYSIDNSFPITALDRIKELNKPNIKILDNRKYPQFLRKIDLEKDLKFFSDQIKLCETALETNTHGILKAPTGSGKSVCFIYLVHKLNTPALVVADRSNLTNQLTISFNQFLPGVKVLTWKEFEVLRKEDLKEPFVVITTTQTLYRRNLESFADSFGLLIFDEVHRCVGEKTREVLMSFNAMYRYGFTATTERNDGGHLVYKRILGPVISETKRKPLEQSKRILKPKLKFIHTEFVGKNRSIYQKYQIMTDLIESDDRNQEITKHFYKEAKGKSSVIFVEFINHAEIIYEILKKVEPNCILFHGKLPEKTKKERLEKIRNSRNSITITTYSSLSTGTDIPHWEVLGLFTPFSSQTRAIQTIGRVVRSEKNKENPFVFDYVDIRNDVLSSLFESRYRTYKKEGLI